MNGKLEDRYAISRKFSKHFQIWIKLFVCNRDDVRFNCKGILFELKHEKVVVGTLKFMQTLTSQLCRIEVQSSSATALLEGYYQSIVETWYEDGSQLSRDD